MLQADIEAFERDGAVLIPRVVDGAWVNKLAAAIDRDIANPGPFFHGYEIESGGRFHGNIRVWENDPDFAAYCLDSPLPGLAAELMGAKSVRLLYDQLFVKDSATDAPTRWHNDQPYWPVRGRQVLSFWLALDEVTLDSGGLEFIAGSHKWDRWFQPEPFAPGGTSYTRNPNYEEIPDYEQERDQHAILSWDMQPGDVIAFHAMTVHYAGPNTRADRQRRGYTVRYIGDDATYLWEEGMASGFVHDGQVEGQPFTGPHYPQVWPASV
ncbi:MAG: ectoine hydroxylase-related dioxygenase (phytanoyl-CoA dioxygenase family) [Acidimicrobiales bacterium]|jgi:ectoine hydroxylase-related dioxygenase (phytanoyl-CoA dioxygenase family)